MRLILAKIWEAQTLIRGLPPANMFFIVSQCLLFILFKIIHFPSSSFFICQFDMYHSRVVLSHSHRISKQFPRDMSTTTSEVAPSVRAVEYECWCGKVPSQMKVGRIAPCGHTFCEDCILSRVPRVTATCPHDKMSIPVSALGVSSFPLNYTTIPKDHFANEGRKKVDAAETKASSSTDVDQVCAFCVSDSGAPSHEAAWYCQTCKISLCANGLKMHNLIAGSREHNLISLEEREKLRRLRGAVSECTTHNKPYIKYNPATSTFLCDECTHGGVAEYELVSLADAAASTLRELEGMLPAINKTWAGLKVAEDRLSSGLAGISTSNEEALTKSKAAFDKLRKTCDEVEGKMVTTLSSRYDQRRSRMATQLAALQMMSDSVVRALTLAGVNVERVDSKSDDDKTGKTKFKLTLGDHVLNLDASSSTGQLSALQSHKASTAAASSSSSSAESAESGAAETGDLAAVVENEALMQALDAREKADKEAAVVAPDVRQLMGLLTDVKRTIAIASRKDGPAAVGQTMSAADIEEKLLVDLSLLTETLKDVKLTNTIRIADAFKCRGHTNTIFTVSASPCGRFIASGCSGSSGTCKIWDQNTGSILFTLEGHKNSVLSVAFSPAGGHLATAGADRKVMLWPLESNFNEQQAVTISAQDIADHVAWSPDGNFVSICSRGKMEVQVFRITTPSQKNISLTGFTKAVGCTAWSPNGQTIVACSTDGSVRVFDARTGRLVATSVENSSYIRHVAWLPDSESFVTGSDDRVVRLWKVETQRNLAKISLALKSSPVSTQSSEFINGMAIHPTDPMVLVGVSRLDEIHLLSLETLKVVEPIKVSATSLKDHSGKAVCFSPAGNAFFVGVANAIHGYNISL